jgi:hypothetical protein
MLIHFRIIHRIFLDMQALEADQGSSLARSLRGHGAGRGSLVTVAVTSQNAIAASQLLNPFRQ